MHRPWLSGISPQTLRQANYYSSLYVPIFIIFLAYDNIHLPCSKVMDGHAGPHTSKLLSHTLIPTVAFELASLVSSSTSATPFHSKSVLDRLKPYITPMPSPGINRSYDADPAYVSAAIKSAFSILDSQIINAPIGHLNRLQSQKSEIAPHEDPMSTPLMLPAMSGSCALLALLDTSRRDMYVACTGDSRAVAGYWDEPVDGGPGYWRAEVLTEDQTGRNPDELKRYVISNVPGLPRSDGHQ